MQEEEIKVWFAHLSNGAISYYRMVQFAYEMSTFPGISPILTRFDPEQHDNFRRDYEVDPDAKATDINQLASMSDIIVAQTVNSTKLLAYLKAYQSVLGKIIVSEFDDNCFEIDVSNVHHKAIGPGTEIERNSYDQIKMSDAIICSTEYLASQMRTYNKRVHVISNAIDMSLWGGHVNKRMPDRICIGWSGGAGHSEDLKPLREPLLKALEMFPNLEVKVIHGAPNFIDHPRFKYIHEDWVPINEYPKAYCDAGFDIVVAPLRDTEFNRCKSNLRYLEASSKKIPVIASSVEPYKKTIQDGVDGFLYTTPNNFLDILEKLVKDPKLRASIGQAGYDKIKKEFSSEVVALKYANILKSIFKEVGNERLSNAAR